MTFRVQVPNMMDKSEWKLSGQAFTITLPLTDTVRPSTPRDSCAMLLAYVQNKAQWHSMYTKRGCISTP